MRLLVLFTFSVLLHAQGSPNLSPVPAGTTQQIVLQIGTAPVSGDAVYFQISTKQLSIVLVTPDGARITERTAEKAGFNWGEIDLTPPIGSTDAGAIGSMHFLRAGLAGRYIVEFTAPSGVHNGSASAHFDAEQDEYSTSMSQVPGFRKVGPFQLSPGQIPLEIVLDEEEEGAILDLATPGDGQFSLTLPNGQIIDSRVGKQGAVSWTMATRDKIDPPGALFGISGFLLPDAGTHDVVTFENAAKGKYQIRAVSNPAQVTAAFIPFGRMIKEATAAITAPPQAPAGQTRIQPYALPYDAKVGDNLTATVGIVGDALSDPRFLVHMEYRQIVSREPLQYSAPVVEAVPTVFTRNAQGLYTSTIVPRRPGTLRVGVEVSGRRPNGQAFSEETVLTEVIVTP